MSASSQITKMPWWLAAIRYLDADRLNRKAEKHVGERKRVELQHCMPFIFLHAGCLLVFIVGWSPFAIMAAIGLYWIRIFGVTAFFHRYFSHRTYKTSRFMQFIFAVWVGTAVQRGALWWASHHRRHHRLSDQPEDIHSPVQRGFWWSQIGWITSSQNLATHYDEVKDFTKFPELVWLNRLDWLVPMLYSFALLGIGHYLSIVAPGLGTNGQQLMVWGFFVSTIMVFHGTSTINSLSHLIGSQRYDTGDTSRNNFILAILTLGEGWHNNHHKYSGAVRQGFYWWEVDITFYVLWIMSKLGLIWDLHPVPKAAYDESRHLQKKLNPLGV